MHVIRADGTILRAGRAALYVLERCGHPWVKLGRIPPFIWFVELGYRIVATHRPFFARFMFRSR